LQALMTWAMHRPSNSLSEFDDAESAAMVSTSAIVKTIITPRGSIRCNHRKCLWLPHSFSTQWTQLFSLPDKGVNSRFCRNPP